MLIKIAPFALVCDQSYRLFSHMEKKVNKILEFSVTDEAFAVRLFLITP